MERLQTRAGRYVAAVFNEGASMLRRELENDFAVAGVRAAELVEKVHQAHTRATLIRWICVGLLAGLGLFAADVCVGTRYL